SFATIGHFEFSQLAFNNIYTKGKTLVKVNDTEYDKLETWLKSDTVRIGINYNEEPIFISKSDLHLNKSQKLSRGQYLGISKDFDGDKRCQYSASIGADEIDFSETISLNIGIADTIYIGENLKIKNKKTIGANNTYLFVDNILVDSLVKGEFKFVFSKVGKAKVKIISKNCEYAESFEKEIVVVDFGAKPISNFSPKNVAINALDTITLNQKVLNGFTKLLWTISPDSFYATSTRL
ncbi:MAG: hypothetical protein ACPGLV_17765, partial [Bacteroidia bacterium]